MIPPIERFRGTEEPTPLVARAVVSPAIKEFHEHGGVVEYVLFDVLSAARDEPVHRQAAIAGMRALAADIPSHQAFQIEFEAPGESRAITVEDFVGPCYDWQRQELVERRGRSPVGGGHRTHCTVGYADAFLEPPYGLRLAPAGASVLFARINRDLFGGLRAPLEIRSWPTDWSNYFDSGDEWWGSFFWTLLAPSLSRICVVTASTTD